MKQSRTLLRFLCAANHGIGTISLVGLLLLSSAAPRFVAAQSAPTESTTNPYANYARFTPSMAIIIVVLVAALFFMAFFSIYIRHCNDPSALAGSTDGTRPPNGRSRRLQRGLDKAVIETFPTLEYSKVKGLKIGKGALECAVCLCEFEDDETLRLIPKCDHVFHPECIDEWLASHTTCPVCRANLVPQPGEEVYQLPELSTEPGASQNGGDGGVTDLERGRPCEDEVSGSTTVQVEELDVVDLNKTLNRNRTRGSRSTRARRFPRSHSTGHSLSLVQPGDDTERFTLRLPVQVRQQIVKRQLDRAMSMVVLPREESLRRGYRTSVGAGAGAGGDGSNRGLRFSFSRRFDRFSRSVRSDRWGFSVVPPFFTKSSSVRSPRVAADVGEGTSIKPEMVSAGETTRPPV